MCISIFYAQVFGLWLFAISAAMIFYPARFKKTLLESVSNLSLVTFSGMCSLAIGLLIVISHNIWIPAWPVIVTLFGWFLILQGIMRLFWPETFSSMLKDLVSKNGLTVWSWFWLIVGAYLIWVGFWS